MRIPMETSEKLVRFTLAAALLMEALLAALAMLLEKVGLTLMTTPSKCGMAVNGFLSVEVVEVAPRISKTLA